MKFKRPDGSEINLRKVNDDDYLRAKAILGNKMDICPTCGGREEYITPGVKQFISRTYLFHGEEVKCDCRLQMALQIRYLLAGIGNEYWAYDWDEEFKRDKGAKEWVANYLKDWEFYLGRGMGVMFSGPTQGVGKTWAAIHIGKEMIKRGQKVLFIDFLQMVDSLVDPDTKQDTQKRLLETTYLILDDVRSGMSDRQTDLYATTFESIIRHRTMFNLPTLTTTNLVESEFEEYFPRLASLLTPKQLWVSIDGTDYRLSEEYQEMICIMKTSKEVRPIV